MKRTTITLPVDQLEFFNMCAKAVGQDRGGFVTLMVDFFYDDIVRFAEDYVSKVKQDKVLTDAKKLESVSAS